MLIVRISFIILIAFLGTHHAASLNDAVAECAKIKRDLKRLACFDKLSGRVDSFAMETLTQKNETSTTEPDASVPQKVVVSPKTPEDQFGLPTKSEVEEVDIIRSYIPGEFSGWEKDDEIRLANGQIWQIIGSTSSLYHKATDPKIEIEKGVFGSYRIRVIGLNKTAQVKRIK